MNQFHKKFNKKLFESICEYISKNAYLNKNINIYLYRKTKY